MKERSHRAPLAWLNQPCLNIGYVCIDPSRSSLTVKLPVWYRRDLMLIFVDNATRLTRLQQSQLNAPLAQWPRDVPCALHKRTPRAEPEHSAPLAIIECRRDKMMREPIEFRLYVCSLVVGQSHLVL